MTQPKRERTKPGQPGKQAGPDQWAHRQLGVRCASCMFYVPKAGTERGRCRRHAPTMNGYPVVTLARREVVACYDRAVGGDPHDPSPNEVSV